MALTSPPAQKARPAPVNTTTPTAASWASLGSASSKAWSMDGERAFRRSGRLRVSTATPSLTTSSRSSAIARLPKSLDGAAIIPLRMGDDAQPLGKVARSPVRLGVHRLVRWALRPGATVADLTVQSAGHGQGVFWPDHRTNGRPARAGVVLSPRADLPGHRPAGRGLRDDRLPATHRAGVPPVPTPALAGGTGRAHRPGVRGVHDARDVAPRRALRPRINREGRPRLLLQPSPDSSLGSRPPGSQPPGTRAPPGRAPATPAQS